MTVALDGQQFALSWKTSADRMNGREGPTLLWRRTLCPKEIIAHHPCANKPPDIHARLPNNLRLPIEKTKIQN